MKPSLVDYLACPTCGGNLSLKTKKERKNEIIEGTLTCLKCKEKFSVKDSIPRFVVDETKNFDTSNCYIK